MRKPIFIILIILGFIIPILAYAALVPCGRCCKTWGTDEDGNRNECVEPCDPENVSWEETQPCTLCDIFRMLQMIINYIWWVLLIIAPLFIIAGGVMILTAGIKPDQLESGKRIITGTIIGLAIAFLSWTILNMTFNTLAKSPGEEGFPWPWNEVRCTGGAIQEQEVIPEEIVGGNTYCHLQIANAVDQMVYNYDTAEECYTECSAHCVGPGINCEAWCCLARNLNGQNGVCSWAPVVDRCDSRSQAGSCFNGEYTCALGVIDQVGRASTQLASLLHCIRQNLPSGTTTLEITSVTDNGLDRCLFHWNTQCASGTDSCTGLCCAHVQNSLHYGGSSCRGSSYAVDILNVSLFGSIQSAINTCIPTNNIFTGTQIINEGNHIHIELDGLARTIGCL